MVNPKSIVVEVAPDGQVTVRAEGYTGPGCVEAVRQLAAALGVADEEEHLPEYDIIVETEAEQGTDLKMGEGGW